MQRMNAEDFMAQVVDELQDLSSELRRHLLEVARLPTASRVRELQKACQEAARG